MERLPLFLGFAAVFPVDGDPSVSLTEVGTAVAIGVLLDTLLVRTVLVPAALLRIGEPIWWPARTARTGPTARTGTSGAPDSPAKPPGIA